MWVLPSVSLSWRRTGSCASDHRLHSPTTLCHPALVLVTPPREQIRCPLHAPAVNHHETSRPKNVTQFTHMPILSYIYQSLQSMQCRSTNLWVATEISFCILCQLRMGHEGCLVVFWVRSTRI